MAEQISSPASGSSAIVAGEAFILLSCKRVAAPMVAHRDKAISECERRCRILPTRRQNGWRKHDQKNDQASCRGALVTLLVLFAGAARAQDAYPDRAIHFIVGFAAGGGNDIFARLVVQKFQENTGATAVIENKVGAGGRIAAEYAARAVRRRLHGAGRRHRADVDRRRDLSQSRLPSDQEFHSAQHDCLVPAGAGGAGGSPRQIGEGTGGLGQGQSRQIELRNLVAGLHDCQ